MNCKITVTGLVQGVGFRPMVAELAENCGLLGQVKNMGGVVEIIVSGNKQAVENFLHRLNVVSGKDKNFETESFANEYRVGRMDTFEMEELIVVGEDAETIILRDKAGECYRVSNARFRITESGNTREVRRFLPVDFPTCDRCKEELFDPKNRRYRYPFISCTQCGPRYSIQKGVPYDRDSITMDEFTMCVECKKEYEEKGNIRRHAQTIACHNCGPQLKLLRSDKDDLFFDINDDSLQTSAMNTERILAETVKALRQECIVAIKDIGGFHFAFSPMSSKAAKRLREFKARDKKPFAVMFFDLEELKEYCEVSPKEEGLLISQARPIVLLKKKKDFVLEICGDSDRIGAMLPCNPLQMLILKEAGPLVMTSGNRGGEPIIIRDEEMEELMHLGCPDMMLTHDREILTPLDDSIYQVNGEFVQLIRRARGLVPEPIVIKKRLQQDVFAAGGDLKAVFALGRDNLVYLSQYFGDLEDVRCTRRREEAIVRMQALLDINPKITIGDMHPSYISAKGMMKKVQHHKAHVASVIAEHGLKGKVLGFAFDGTGFGTDGTIWGSEVFLYEEKIPMEKTHSSLNENGYQTEAFTRIGHLVPVKLLGGDSGAKEADKTLFSYMMEAGKRKIVTSDSIFKNGENMQENSMLKLQEMAWQQNINTVDSSSMGRLFDAAAALLDICHYNSYEGECAALLEQAAHRGKVLLEQDFGTKAAEMISVNVEKNDGVWLVDGVQFLVDLLQLKECDKLQKYVKTQDIVCEDEVKRDVLAYLFHHAIVNAFVFMAGHIGREYDVKQIALSGGSFMNRILLPEMVNALREEGFLVYTNEKVPCGDGGIALGQIYDI